MPRRAQLLLVIVTATAAAQAPVRVSNPGYTAEHPVNKAPQRPTVDKNGNPLRYAVTGHVSNYDETKVGDYTLPDPLVLQNGERVRDAETWLNQRRPEIVRLYETEIYGRVPPTAPNVTFETVAVQESALEGTAVRKHVVGRFGRGADAPTMNLVMVLPAHANGPVPVLLHLVFSAGLQGPRASSPEGATPGNTPRFMETGPVADILAQGYGYATLRYTEIEGDRAETSLSGVRKLALAPDQKEPAPDEWGTIAAWSWGASRALDYFESDPAIDARRVGLIGHSRLGKTVLWAAAPKSTQENQKKKTDTR
jgi:hypothetical protein